MEVTSIFSLIDPEVYLITARDGDRESGMIATWVWPATLLEDRARIVCALSPEHHTTGLIKHSRRFVVQLLAEEQVELVPRFGLPRGAAGHTFDPREIDRSPATQLPILRDTVGYAECEVIAEITAGERWIALAAVAREKCSGDKKPLRLSYVMKALPHDVVRAIETQRRADGQRDRRLVANG